jgi:hypothetical protein
VRTHFLAVLEALRFHNRSAPGLETIPENIWPALLRATDSSHLTLALGVRHQSALPESVRARIDRNLAGNAARYDRVLAAHSQITAALSLYGIEYVVLKGLSQWPYYCDDPRKRSQYDIDIYVPDESMSRAVKAVRDLGYEPVSDTPDPGADHLPAMIRKTGWTWRGDYYDPEMPLSLELHFRFWNLARLRFDVGDVTEFWRRRIVRQVGGLELPTLDPVDGLTYSALHLIRHLLEGDLRLGQVYEIAHFLERSAEDETFWLRWHETGLPSCRVMEGIVFRLAVEWFDCSVHPRAQETIEQLPAPVKRWFSLFALSPAPGIGDPNKNELWLHFCLLNNWKDRWAIAIRRLLPTSRARVVLDAHVPPSKVNDVLRVRRVAGEASFMAKRFLHHLRTLAPTIRGAYLWWSAPKSQGDRKCRCGTAQP